MRNQPKKPRGRKVLENKAGELTAAAKEFFDRADRNMHHTKWVAEDEGLEGLFDEQLAEAEEE